MESDQDFMKKGWVDTTLLWLLAAYKMVAFFAVAIGLSALVWGVLSGIVLLGIGALFGVEPLVPWTQKFAIVFVGVGAFVGGYQAYSHVRETYLNLVRKRLAQERAAEKLARCDYIRGQVEFFQLGNEYVERDPERQERGEA